MSYQPTGQEPMEIKRFFGSVAPALNGFIINRFI